MLRFTMNTLRQDLRYAIRSLGRSPSFCLVAVLSLAIGIGANTTIFSVANALLLRSLPYKDAERLVILWNRSPGLNITQDWFSPAQYFDIKTGHQGFEQLAIFYGGIDTITGDGEPERVGTIHVSSNLLPMLGVEAKLGRVFATEDDSPGLSATAVLTYGMWARRYGHDPRVLGKSIIINGVPHEIIGVLPQSSPLPHEDLPTLYGADRTDVLLSFPLASGFSSIRTHEDYNILGKIKQGVTLQAARAEMDTITARLRRDYPDSYPPNGGLTFGIVPLREQVVGDVRTTLLVLLGSVGFVLLIACANVANLSLSRALARQQEIAVRTALGASRGRLILQFVTESVLLALCGGTLGVVLCVWSVKWIHILGAKNIPRLDEIGIDGRVLLFTLLLSICSGVLFGIVPALRFSDLDLNATLKDASRGSARASAVWGRGNNLRRSLVVCELALSVVLLIGAGLLIRSLQRLQGVSPGFNPRNVLTFDLALGAHRYDDKQVVLNTYRRLWESFQQLPGISASGGITSLPLSQAFAWTPITIEGREPLPGEKFINADERVVGGEYFQAMGIPLRRGRFFNERDTVDMPRVVLIDEYMAQQFWPNEDPIGKRIHVVQLKTSDPWQTVVGVVGRVKHDSLDSEPRIAFYLAQTQFPVREMSVVLRGKVESAGLTASIKKEIRDIDPDLPMTTISTMTQRVDESLARRRFGMVLLAVFAGLALVLATMGIYGVMAYLVSQGTRELGIRMALGATRRNILSLIVRQGMLLAFAGMAIGLAGAFSLTRLLRSLLFGVEATDPLTFGAITILLGATALLASYIPAQRAARIDPMISLRCE